MLDERVYRIVNFKHSCCLKSTSQSNLCLAEETTERHVVQLSIRINSLIDCTTDVCQHDMLLPAMSQ